MKRTTYRQPVQRCQAITQKKKQCTRDAVVMHKNLGYCMRHYEAELARKKLCGPNTTK